MKSFKTWLRNKFREYLGIDNLESNFINHETFNSIRFYDIEEDYENKIQILEKDILKRLQLINSYLSSDIKYCKEGIDTLHNTIENVVHIGTDVRENYSNREHSWAVVCIEGKINIVKFVDLNRNDGKYVLEFLKQFEAGRHCIDTPRKEIFYDNMFKF